MKTFRIFRFFSDYKPATCYYKTLNIPTYADINTIRRAYL